MEKAEASGAGKEWAAAAKWQLVKINAMICAGVAALWIALIAFNNLWLTQRELVMGDSLTEARGGGSVNDQMVLVGIDDASLDILDLLDEEEVEAHPELEAMSYGYPFPRSVYGAAVQKVVDAGARLVIFDMIFTGDGEGDDVFKAVIEANPNKVVLGANLSWVEDERGGGAMQLAMPSDSVIDTKGPSDSRVGIVNLSPDSDGKIRAIKFLGKVYDNVDEPYRPTIVMAALKQLGLEDRVADPHAVHHVRFPDFSVADSFYPTKSLYTLFDDTAWEKNYDSGEFFRDKIVLIGGTSVAGFHDVIQVPVGDILGPRMHLNSLAAALDGSFYEVSGKTAQVVSVLMLALVGFGIAFVMRKPIVGLIALVACGAAYLALVRWCFFDFSVLLPIASPIYTLGLAGIGCFGNRFVLEQLEKARLRRTLERQVSKDLAEHILSMPEDYYESLPGVRKPVTVLFSDIRGFTSRSEKDDPVTLVSQLREYLDLMGEIVFKHRGVVDKFIGDAVMAVWGNLRSEGVEQDTRSAVAAAVEMQLRLAELNAKWAKDGLEPYEIGIGLNQGHVIFGMMGSEQKQEMTVIGDAVNQAARLEGLTKKFGMEVIVGPRVAKYVRDDFALRSLGKVQTMGKKEAEELFGVFQKNQDEAQVDWTRRYHDALAAFNAGDLETSQVGFESCASDQPDDLTTKMYLDAIARGDSGGVLVMTGK